MTYKNARSILLCTPHWCVDKSDEENVVAIAEDVDTVLTWAASEEVLHALTAALLYFLLRKS